MMMIVEQSVVCELAGEPKYSENPTPVPLCPPQIQHDLTWARTRADAVGSRRLAA
jgi:hypothetical protein